MGDSQISSTLDACDQLLKNGQVNQAQAILCELAEQQIPRRLTVTVARLCRRARLIEKGLKLLTPILLTDSRASTPRPMAEEIIEYAVLLSWIGSHEEALSWLKPIDHGPEVHLHRAFCHIRTWNYSAAIRDLEIAAQTETDPYRALVAAVNLASAQIHGEHLEDGLRLTEKNLAQATNIGAKRLAGNCHEQRGEALLKMGELDSAEQALAQAAKCLEGSQWDTLLVEQWQSVLDAMRSHSPAPIFQFQAKARWAEMWESVREMDFYRLKIDWDDTIYRRLLAGTPFAPFQQKVATTFNQHPRMDFFLGPSEKNFFDPVSGEITTPASADNNPGIKICRLIQGLTRDLYAPARLGGLFHSVYSGEHFDVYSSPQRVRQLVHRARGWFEREKLGIGITVSNGCFRVTVHGSTSIRVASRAGQADSSDRIYNTLASAFPSGQAFTSSEASRVLGMSLSQFTRQAKSLLERKLLERSGAGRSTFYRTRGAA